MTVEVLYFIRIVAHVLPDCRAIGIYSRNPVYRPGSSLIRKTRALCIRTMGLPAAIPEKERFAFIPHVEKSSEIRGIIYIRYGRIRRRALDTVVFFPYQKSRTAILCPWIPGEPSFPCHPHLVSVFRQCFRKSFDLRRKESKMICSRA